jgi:hypothetical protein
LDSSRNLIISGQETPKEALETLVRGSEHHNLHLVSVNLHSHLEAEVYLVEELNNSLQQVAVFLEVHNLQAQGLEEEEAVAYLDSSLLSINNNLSEEDSGRMLQVQLNLKISQALLVSLINSHHLEDSLVKVVALSVNLQLSQALEEDSELDKIS